VVVLGDAAVENIIRKAVNNIPKNYPTYPTTALGFYRESRTDDSLNYIYLAEGVLNIYKKGYKSNKEGQVSLVQGRLINLNNPLDTTVYSNFSSGHMAAHRFDFVKNRVDFIDERFFPVYNYWIENITYYNDKKVYIIGFDKDYEVEAVQGEVIDEGASDGGSYSLIFKSLGKKKKKKIKARMKGRIFIEQESYAFLRAEFEITKEGLKKYNDYPLYAGSWDGNSYVVNYRYLGDKWFFSDALREGKYGGGGLYNNEIKITEINSEKADALPYNDRIRRGEKFTKVTGEYDDDFWKNYNTTPLNEGLAESVLQMETIKKAQEVFDAEYMEELQAKRDSIQKIESKKIQAELSEDYNFGESDLFENSLPSVSKKKKKLRDYSRVNFMLGLGSHFISTEEAQMGITYFAEKGENSDTIIAVNEQMPGRDFEINWNADIDISLNRNLFFRLGLSGDFYNSIYKESSIGFGGRVNFSKQRPFYLKGIASYSNLRYARYIGQAKNDYGEFRANGKKFNSDYINMYYGSRTKNIKLAAEFAIELNPGRELYVRGSYFLPINRRQEVWLWERGQLFRKKRYIPVNDEGQINVDRNGEPFSGQIMMPDQTLSITVGILFK
jgi:hypothetical protein